MSHVTKVNCKVKDLDALETAAEKLGGELRRGQTSFRMWGSAQPCEHAVAVKDRPGAYEVGLRRDATDPGAWEFACDFYDGTLARQFGPNLVNLQNEYLAVVAERQLAAAGWRTVREEQRDALVVRAFR